MQEISRLAGRYPWAIVGLAGVAGWVLGAGVLPFGIPGLSSATPAIAPVAPAPAGAPTSGAPLATSSAAMAPAGGPVDDPFAGYGI